MKLRNFMPNCLSDMASSSKGVFDIAGSFLWDTCKTKIKIFLTHISPCNTLLFSNIFL